MERSRLNLARKVNALADGDRATVTELRDRLVLYQLDGRGAREVIDLLKPAGFVLDTLSDEGGVFGLAELVDDAEGVQLSAWKPAGVPEGIFPVLTLVGFQALFSRTPDEAIIWVEGLTKPIDTLTISYRPWGDDTPFIPEDEPTDPARVVRDLSDANPPERIGRWLLRDAEAVVSGPAAAPWRMRATKVLAKALAQEIERDGQLLFRGPPPTRFDDHGGPIEASPFTALQKAAHWVYENPRELENRHGLIAAEIARTSSRCGDLVDLASLGRRLIKRRTRCGCR